MIGSLNENEIEDIVEGLKLKNERIWAIMQEHGVKEGDELCLEFFYYTRNRKAAEDLAAYLRENTNYTVGVGSRGLIFKNWHVTGETQRTAVSLAHFDDWSEWMARAGARFGIVFDGWGALIDNAS